MSSRFFDRQRDVAIDINSSGDNTLISAPANGYIVIDHINVLPTSAVTLTLKTGSTSRTGPYPLDAKQALTLENPSEWEHGLIDALPAEAFIINLSGAVQVGGFIRYRIIGQ